VETAADHQVDVSVICCDCDVAATAHAVPAFGGGERGPALGLVPKGPCTYGGKKWKRPIEKEYKPTYRRLV